LCEAKVRAFRQWRSRFWLCFVADAPPTSNNIPADRIASSSTIIFAF
jgi:hypothetical protein